MEILNKAEKSVLVKNNEFNWSPADSILVAAFLFPDEMIVKDDFYIANVELKGDHTRGQLVLNKNLEYKRNTRVVKLVNRDFFKTIILRAAGKH